MAKAGYQPKDTYAYKFLQNVRTWAVRWYPGFKATDRMRYAVIKSYCRSCHFPYDDDLAQRAMSEGSRKASFEREQKKLAKAAAQKITERKKREKELREAQQKFGF